MFIDLTDRQRELRAEIDSYFTALMTPERRASLGGGEQFGEIVVGAANQFQGRVAGDG